MRQAVDSVRRALKRLAPGLMAVSVLGVLAMPAWTAPSRPVDNSAPQTIKPVIPGANRYQEGKVFLEHADKWTYKEQPDLAPEEQYQVLVGNVAFRKNDMFMYCDSAHFYEQSNSFDAFSNVRMEQGDTLFVYADELNYDGATEIAVLYADAGKKVRLINRDVKLETDVFNYDIPAEVGYYEVGGELSDLQNTLTSLQGEYHPNTKDAFFYLDVELNSLNNSDTLRMFTDSLHYNTETHIAQLIAQTRIVNKDGEIRSTSGTYNTETGLADLYKRSLVVTNRGNTLTGDTLFYDRDRGIGEAFGNMVLTDSARSSALFGDYGYYDDRTDSAFVTGRALAKEYSRPDTLYLHGDTIFAYLDKEDSTRVMNVFHKVRFYRSDLQGICDSLSSTERDSMMYMYRHPVVWSGERQIFGNVINVHFNDSTVDWAKLPEFGFMAEHLDEDCFQQMSGTEMTAWFNDSTIRHLFVEGNVMLIMFPMENDSTYNKYAYVESSVMDAWFEANDIERILFTPATTAKVVPLYLAKKGSYFLQKFAWYEDIRPLSPEDVFIVPERMVELINSAPAATVVKRTKPARRSESSEPPKNPEPTESTEISEVSEHSDNL
ncbi:MAG: LPS export ABC transporter periplasmic protein LptC [Muribaculaceae bacterium]|nr:LPS export ABC transporter periplasmic protein LptC [Muribaculaceae bacterium]